jgi:hypothetical protein
MLAVDAGISMTASANLHHLCVEQGSRTHLLAAEYPDHCRNAHEVDSKITRTFNKDKQNFI